MEKQRLIIKVEGENTEAIIRRTLIQLLHYGIKNDCIYYTGNWHEPATDEEINCGRHYGTNHRHVCDVEKQLYYLLTKGQDSLFQFMKEDGEFWAVDVHPIVETLGSYEHEWFDEEDGSEDKVVDLTVHSKFAKYK